MEFTGAGSLEELAASESLSHSEQLAKFAATVYDRFFSREAIVHHHLLPADEKDDVYHRSHILNSEVPRYVALDSAIKQGDVGMMDHFLAHLLFRCAGGGQSKYLYEYLELAQSKREIPPDQM